MAKELKTLIVDELKARFKELDGCVLIDYRGLNAEQTENLRAALHDSGVRMNVIPNRLARLAFADSDAPEEFKALLVGPTAMLFGGEGALTASKSIVEWRKKNEELTEIKGGLFQGDALTPADVERLASIPDTDTMRRTIAGMLLGPLAVLATSAQSLVGHFAGCVKAHHESESGGS